MNKIEYKSEVIKYAKFDNYIIELTNNFFTLFDNTDIWIYNKEYGIKMHCIGLIDVEQSFIDEYILANIKDWIDLYKRCYED